MPPKMDLSEEKKEAPKIALPVAGEGKEEKKEHKEVKASLSLKKKPFVLAEHLAELKANRITTLDLSDQDILDAHQATLIGHTNSVYALAILPNGRLASGSEDKDIRLWDTEKQSCVSTLTGHTDSIYALTVLPDGGLASGSGDYNIRLWDTDKNTCVSILTGHTDTVSALAVLSDGRLASGSHDHRIRLWNTTRKISFWRSTCIATLTGHTGHVYALVVLPDGRLASGSSDCSIRLWDTHKKTVTTLTGHTSAVCALAVLPDGCLASGSVDRNIRLWDTDKKTCVSTLIGHTDFIHGLAALPNGRLASGSSDYSIRLWDTDQKTCVSILTGYTSRVIALAVLPDKRLASGSTDCSIRLWTITQRRALTCTDIKPLFTALQTNTSINILNLQTVRLEDTSITDLVDLLCSNSRLTELNLQNTGLSLEALRTLYTSTREHTPSLTIRHELIPALETEIITAERLKAEADKQRRKETEEAEKRAKEAKAIETHAKEMEHAHQESVAKTKAAEQARQETEEKSKQEAKHPTEFERMQQEIEALKAQLKNKTDTPAPISSSSADLTFFQSLPSTSVSDNPLIAPVSASHVLLSEPKPAPAKVPTSPAKSKISLEKTDDVSSSLSPMTSDALKKLPSVSISDNPLVAPVPDSHVPLSEPKPAPTKGESKTSSEENKSAPALELSASWLIPDEQLTLGKKLGNGGYGVVYQGIRHPYIDVAIKQLLIDTLSKETITEFKKEALMMANLHSPYTVQFYGYSLSPHCRLVMEYMPKGSLYSVLHSEETLTPDITYRIVTDIACGVAFLHSKHILHRDLKSPNVLLDKYYGAKLSDFGLAKVKAETRTLSTKGGSIGTLAWMAPELMQCMEAEEDSESKEVKTPHDPFTTKADIYSMGITFWEVAARKRPFEKVPNPVMISVLAAQGKHDKIPADCPPKLASLIRHCRNPDPAKRPTAEEVAHFLRSAETEFKPAAIAAPKRLAS